jgi:hypothetical protein
VFLLSYLDGRRSIFPEGGVDQFLELYNLPASQKGNIKRFQELKIKENLSPSEQEDLNSLTIALQHYIIDVETWNKFADAIVNLENFFLNETEPYLQAKKAEITNYTDTKMLETTNYVDTKKLEFQAEVDKMTYRGEWQPNTQYLKKNIVTSGGNGYIAKLDNINQSPPNATYWGQISKKGDKGDPSLNINYKGTYEPSMPYVLGDAVTFGGLWYYAKQNTIGNPPTDATYWELQNNQVLVGDTEPFDNRIVGWIDTSI